MHLQVENMPAEEFAALWQRYIAAYAELLLEASSDTPADSPALQRLVSLLLVSATHTSPQLRACYMTEQRRQLEYCRLQLSPTVQHACSCISHQNMGLHCLQEQLVKEGFHLHVTIALKDPNSHVWQTYLHKLFSICAIEHCTAQWCLLQHKHRPVKPAAADLATLPMTDAPWEVCASGGGRLAAACSHADTGAGTQLCSNFTSPSAPDFRHDTHVLRAAGIP